MKLITFCASFILILTSCTSKKSPDCAASVDVIFINKASTPSSLLVSNGTDSVVITALAGASQTKPLCFNKNPKIDGNYTLHIKNIRKDTVIYPGYFTNGYPSEKSIRVVFEKDTLSFQSILPAY